MSVAPLTCFGLLGAPRVDRPRGGLFNTEVEVQYPDRTDDGLGGYTTTWQTRYAVMPCRIRLLTGVEEPVGGQQASTLIGRMHFDAGYGVERSDRVVWENNGTTRIFNVLAVIDAHEQGRRKVAKIEEVG